MKRKDIKNIAKQIFILEQKYQKEDKSVAKEIEQISLSLSLEDMFAIDEYIQENLLTK